MDPTLLPDNPYLLLTPGPLSTSRTVRAALFRDWCTWDEDYKSLVRGMCRDLTALAAADPEPFVAVPMQGSGTFAVEAAIGTAVPRGGGLLVLANGAYGQRMAEIARRLSIPVAVYDAGETGRHDLSEIDRRLAGDQNLGHVAVVHCETTTGMENPVKDIGAAVRARGRVFIVDAMSSLGGMPFDMEAVHADMAVSSANKCIQGVPGFGFVIARRAVLAGCAGRARSLSLDLYDQWRVMEEAGGKWRFTSPTHVVRAFIQALAELAVEGGVAARHARYVDNNRVLVAGMRALGFETLLPDAWRSPIITSFLSPSAPDYDFGELYRRLKMRGFVIYPGKVTGADTFRIGNIGHVFPTDMERLVAAVGESMFWS